MRICKLLAVVAAATLAGAACAAPSSITEAAAPLVSVQTIAAAAHRMPGADAAGLSGTYDLSNGETLRVSFERRRLYAEMGQGKSELVPAGGSSYIARDSGMRLQFDQRPFATDVVVSGR